MSALLRWGYSPLDRRHHAVDESREHPRGALRTECGHLLILSAWLSEEPAGRTCGACAEIQADRAVTRQVPQQPGGAR
ncbi:MAG: hypothetical protein ACRDQ9_17800 [Pseudonocardiaceae bacterium]